MEAILTRIAEALEAHGENDRRIREIGERQLAIHEEFLRLRREEYEFVRQRHEMDQKIANLEARRASAYQQELNAGRAKEELRTVQGFAAEVASQILKLRLQEEKEEKEAEE